MSFPKYPKIETLWNRDPKTFKVIPGDYRCHEFAAVNSWLVTEKIDGTNIRIHWDGEKVQFGGRTDNAQIHANLYAYLAETFTSEKLAAVITDTKLVTLFGEGYGPKIQKVGARYRSSLGFRLFDVLVGDLWLAADAVEDIGWQFTGSVNSCTYGVDDWHGVMPTNAAVKLFDRKPLLSMSAVFDGGDASLPAEGIVARSHPLMLDRRGRRIMWKLKAKDFPNA